MGGVFEATLTSPKSIPYTISTQYTPLCAVSACKASLQNTDTLMFKPNNQTGLNPYRQIPQCNRSSIMNKCRGLMWCWTAGCNYAQRSLGKSVFPCVMPMTGFTPLNVSPCHMQVKEGDAEHQQFVWKTALNSFAVKFGHGKSSGHSLHISYWCWQQQKLAGGITNYINLLPLTNNPNPMTWSKLY